MEISLTNVLDLLTILFYVVAAIYFSVLFFLKKEKTRTLALFFLILGFTTHFLDLVVFGLEHHRFPASSLREGLSLLMSAVIFLLILTSRKIRIEAAALVLLPLAVVAVAWMWLGPAETAEPLDPVIKGGWIYIHIPLMILSVASLSISFLMAVMYLLQEHQLKTKKTTFFLDRLPSLEVCEDLSFRGLWVGFFLLTLGITTGMIWSHYLRGVIWSWDYKEVWALITWTLYLVLINGRLLSWRGRKAAYLAILGYVFILFAFAGVSLVFKSYHSF